MVAPRRQSFLELDPEKDPWVHQLYWRIVKFEDLISFGVA